MERLTDTYRCIVAEGPLWDEATNSLLFVDILGECVYKMDYTTKNIQKIEVGQQIGCVALCENADLLLAMQDGIYRMNAKGEINLAHQPIRIKGRRLNDGKVGPDGCFYVGSADANANGAFYRLKNGVLEELFDGCGCSNGLDWSMDQKKLFYCDSVLQKIEIFDFDTEQGTLKNRRPYIQIPNQLGVPDGFVMDENDHIWLGLWGGNAVVEITDKGVFGQRLDIPAKKASSCCFAGQELNDLVITSASKDDKEDYPFSGYLFVQKMDIKGKRTFRYKG